MLAAQALAVRRSDLMELAPPQCDEAVSAVLGMLERMAEAPASEGTTAARTARICHERVRRTRHAISRAAASLRQPTPGGGSTASESEGSLVGPGRATDDPVLAQLFTLLDHGRPATGPGNGARPFGTDGLWTYDPLQMIGTHQDSEGLWGQLLGAPNGFGELWT